MLNYSQESFANVNIVLLVVEYRFVELDVGFKIGGHVSQVERVLGGIVFSRSETYWVDSKLCTTIED